ncbi:MAG: 30S ribosomal protein S2 [Candidatus Hydrogenedens sp.]|nr:30S ribosomal protein S2 [Candidatus Hydrogenedens sp.]
MAVVTMRQLLEAGIHFGHQTRRWHPKMKRYIHGQRNGIYIIDLQQTLRQLYKSYGLVRDTVAKGGTVLFVGTKRQAQEVVEREANRCGMYYMTNRWLGGTLTNFKTVKQSIAELKRLRDLEKDGKLERYSKKEASMMRKRMERLEKNLAGIENMPGLPDLIFVVSVKTEGIAVREGQRLGIPVIGVVDTNCDPDLTDIAIPGNDDAIRALGLYCSIIADAAIEGRMTFQKHRAEENDKRAAAAEGAIEDISEDTFAEADAADDAEAGEAAEVLAEADDE